MTDQSTRDPDAIQPEALRQYMQALDLSQAALARLVAVDAGAPGRWLSGAVAVPLWLADHLRLLVELRRLCGAIWAVTPVGEPLPIPNRLAHVLDSVNRNKSDEFVSNEKKHAIMEVMSNPSDEAHKMQPEDFRKALAAIGWKQATFARRSGFGTNTVNSWAQGNTPIPAWVPVHLSLLMEIQTLHARFVQP